jgi:hypothetical protein
MIHKTTLAPDEAADMVSRALGEPINAKRLLYWSRHGTAGFPKLEIATHAKFLRFNRASVAAWITMNVKPSSAPERAATRRRAARS